MRAQASRLEACRGTGALGVQSSAHSCKALPATPTRISLISAPPHAKKKHMQMETSKKCIAKYANKFKKIRKICYKGKLRFSLAPFLVAPSSCNSPDPFQHLLHHCSPTSGRALKFIPGSPLEHCSHRFGFCIAIESRSSGRRRCLFRCLLIPSPLAHIYFSPPCTTLFSPSGCSQYSDGPSKSSPDPPRDKN